MPRRYYLLVVLSFFSQFLFAQVDSTKRESIQQRLINTDKPHQFGSEGFGMGTRIQGTSVLNIESSPLIVVDGIPYIGLSKKGFDFATADEWDYAAWIGISHDDIKEIVLLQDAPSIAQYGINGVNGVILITTHRGTSGKIQVNYGIRNTLGVQPRGYEVLNGPHYSSLILEAYMNSMGVPLNMDIHKEFANDPNDPYNFYNFGQNTDWTKAITQRSFTQEHNLSLSGGNNKLNYHLSAGYLNGDGTTIGTGQRRFTSRFVLDYNFLKYLKASLGIDYMYSLVDSNYHRYGYLPISELALKEMPNMSIYEYDDQGKLSNNYFISFNGIQGSRYINPLALANLAKDKRKTNRVIPTFSLSYQPLKQLSYTLSFSYTNNTVKKDIFLPKELYSAFINDPDIDSSSNRDHNILYTKNQIVYTPQINNSHSFLLVASYSTMVSSRSLHSVYNDNLHFSQNAKYKNYISIIRANYLAYNKYLLDVCGRGEQRTIDNKSYQYTIDPSASFQWFASRENFMKSLTFLNDFSLKVSYGKYSNPVYPDRTEKYIQQEAGLNLAMFESRLNIGLILYKRDIKDQFLMQPNNSVYSPSELLVTTNSNSYWDMENKGFEFNIHTSIIHKQDFSVDFALNLYKNLKTISKVSSAVATQIGSSSYNGSYIRTLDYDKPIGSINGYCYKGAYVDIQNTIATDKSGNSIYSIDNQGIFRPVYMKTPNGYVFQEGDAKYADLNYDGVMDGSDITEIGNANPILTGSGGPTIRYKGWWLGVYFNFRFGNDIVNRARMDLESMYTSDNQSSAVLKRWRKSGDITDIPRALYNKGYNFLGSDRFVENGSFLRLKAITLKHQFADVLVKKLHLSSLSCYFTCKNMFTITKYEGADPDISLYNSSWNNYGYDYNYTPQSMEFSFGLNVGI